MDYPLSWFKSGLRLSEKEEKLIDFFWNNSKESLRVVSKEEVDTALRKYITSDGRGG